MTYTHLLAERKCKTRHLTTRDVIRSCQHVRRRIQYQVGALKSPICCREELIKRKDADHSTGMTLPLPCDAEDVRYAPRLNTSFPQNECKYPIPVDHRWEVARKRKARIRCPIYSLPRLLTPAFPRFLASHTPKRARIISLLSAPWPW